MKILDGVLRELLVRGAPALLLLLPAAAQGLDWYPVTPTHRPPARWGFDMVYDSLRDVTVLFAGGTTGSEDTWIFDGADWQEQSPAVRPPGRSYHAMAYDAARDRVVVFGGIRYTWPFDLLQDTWTWDGSQWSQAAPLHVPPARANHRMAYDTIRQRTVLYGGNGPSGALQDTWEWDGADWLQRTPAHAPPVHFGSAMAYDAHRGRTVLFGSYLTAETWEWDGADWLLQAPATSPPPRGACAMAYDASRAVVVMTGGIDGGNVLMADTWQWDGADWQQIATAHPFADSGHTAVYETARHRMLAFGGTRDWLDAIDETRALASLAAPPDFATFGAGCAGSAGPPSLDAAVSLPFLGAPFDLELGRLPADTFGFLILGGSDASCWHLILPAELSSFLMPGCYLYTDIASTVWFQAQGDRARCVVAVPPLQALEGLRFFFQALVYDPPANARGFTSTNAAAAVVGSWR